MSPTKWEIAEACGISDKIVGEALVHLRAVNSQMFSELPKKSHVIVPKYRAPYEVMVDDYPASTVFAVIGTLRNMSHMRKGKYHKELKDLDQRIKYKKLDVRPLLFPKPDSEPKR